MKNADDLTKNKQGSPKGDKKALAAKSMAAIKAAREEGDGTVSDVARRSGLTRATVRMYLRRMGLDKKPMKSGSMDGNVAASTGLPPAGRVRRFLLTSAQNNTPLNERMWRSLQALASHLDASIMVGTFTYNTNAYGKLSVKMGTEKERIKELWYDPRLKDFIVDRRVELGNGLVWCGEMNILPTAVDPLSGLETYEHRKSAIFPHAKLAMKSIPVMQGEWAKQEFTTGCVTQQNYIQKKEGLKAEHHHSYSALMVEVNDKGNWWVRQVHSNSKTGEMQDLDVLASGDSVATGVRTEAVTWGDLHATMVDEGVMNASLSMLDALRPKFQFFHDILEGASINRHQIKDPSPHYAFYRWLRGFHRVDAELEATVKTLSEYRRPWSQMVAVDSNHDGWWLWSWLKRYDYRKDPANAELFLYLQNFAYEWMRGNPGKYFSKCPLVEVAMKKCGLDFPVKFLLPDESFTLCDKKIECGMHGHMGPNGARGTPQNLKDVGRRANTAHTHSPEIRNGLYVAGTSSKMDFGYNMGPSGWNHAHILTYPNGARTIVTMYDGRWRA